MDTLGKESQYKRALDDEDFDYDEYYRNFKFDPKSEITKERKIEEFFRVNRAY